MCIVHTFNSHSAVYWKCMCCKRNYLYNVLLWPSIKQTVTKKNDIYLLLLIMFDIPLKFACIEKPCVEKKCNTLASERTRIAL